MLRERQRTLRHRTQSKVEGASLRLLLAGLPSASLGTRKPCPSTAGGARPYEADGGDGAKYVRRASRATPLQRRLPKPRDSFTARRIVILAEMFEKKFGDDILSFGRKAISPLPT